MRQARSTPPYNRGWGVTSGDLKGFKVFYSTVADGDLTPTLGPSENIPSFALPDLTPLGTPLNPEPSGIVFKQPLWIEFPCPGYANMNDLSLGLYDEGKWTLVWEGRTAGSRLRAKNCWMGNRYATVPKTRLRSLLS